MRVWCLPVCLAFKFANNRIIRPGFGGVAGGAAVCCWPGGRVAGEGS